MSKPKLNQPDVEPITTNMPYDLETQFIIASKYPRKKFEKVGDEFIGIPAPTEQEIFKEFEELGYHICQEKWEKIKDFPNYEISNLGNVRNSKMKLLKPHKKQKGYLQVQLYYQNRKKKFSIHRLVAQSFIPNPNNYSQVNHRNGIKTDNKVCNLEWCSPLYNNLHAIKTGLRKPFSNEEKIIRSERMKRIRPNMNERYREVVGINLITGETRNYHRIVDAEKDGFSKSGVYATCCGKVRWHKGWFWHYKEDKVEVKIIEKIKLIYQQYLKEKEAKGNVCFANIVFNEVTNNAKNQR